MKQIKNFIAAVPHAKTESERTKYVILRVTVALFAAIFSIALIILKIYETPLSSTLFNALELVWTYSVIMYPAMWFLLSTRFYKFTFLVWAIGLGICAYTLIAIAATEGSVYRTLVFLTISLLIISVFLRRRHLYLIAFCFYAAVVAALDKASLATAGFIFPVTILWAFSIAAFELVARIRNAEEQILAHERAGALHASRLSTIGETTAYLVHEVSTPLTILNGHLELMQKKEDVEYHIAKMQNALDRAIDFIASVKKMVRSDQPNEYEDMQLSEILKLVSNLVEPSLQRKGIRLEFEYNEDIELLCRPAEIAQVILNLINNSADALAAHINRWIRVSCRADKNYLDIEVTDPGSGIEPRIASKMMNPFFTTKATGSGIGLSIAQQIAQNHNGRIEVVSLKNPTVIRLRVAVTPDFVRTAKESALPSPAP